MWTGRACHVICSLCSTGETGSNFPDSCFTKALIDIVFKNRSSKITMEPRTTKLAWGRRIQIFLFSASCIPQWTEIETQQTDLISYFLFNDLLKHSSLCMSPLVWG